MGKLNRLLGIANNLAHSFIAGINTCFLDHISSIPVEKTKTFEIDLLKETFEPKEVMNEMVRNTIKFYKKWFLSEIEKLKINLEDIQKVIIKITYKPGKSFGKYYTCKVTITSRSKNYEKEARVSVS